MGIKLNGLTKGHEVELLAVKGKQMQTLQGKEVTHSVFVRVNGKDVHEERYHSVEDAATGAVSFARFKTVHVGGGQ